MVEMNRQQRESFALRSLALHKTDKAPLNWRHLRIILVAGVGFFADAYDLFAVNFVNILMGYVYFPENNLGTLPPPYDLGIKMASSVGTVIGQIGFGVLNDMYGRKKMYGTELIIMIVATLSLTLGTTGQSVNVIGITIFWRVILGIGIGGDYPNSSVLVSEFSNVRWRGAMMALMFSAQGFGAFSAALVSFLCVTGFQNSLHVPEDNCDVDCRLALDKSWRIVYGFGILPAVIALYFRLTIPETPRFTLDTSRNESKAAIDAVGFMDGTHVEDARALLGAHLEVEGGFQAPPKASLRDFKRFFGLWKNGKVLLGTAGSWFLLDIAFYGIGLNTSPILQIIGFSPSGNDTVLQNLRNLGIGNIILSLAGLIPGYFLSVAFVDTVGRKRLQICGFMILTVIFSIFGFGFYSISSGGLVALVCLANLFANFGPNTTTFIVPGEVFPTRYRSTGHGISAASGKIGAIISQAFIGPLRNQGGPDAFLNHVMQIFAFFMLLGVATSSLIPESKQKSLEELSGELSYIIMPDLSNGQHNSFRPHGFGLAATEDDTTELEEIRVESPTLWKGPNSLRSEASTSSV